MNLKLYAAYNPDYQKMANIFMNTIPKDIDINVECITTTGSMEWLAPEFNNLHRQSWEKMLIDLKSGDENVLAGTIDMDIQFFKPIKETILSCMEGKDICVMREWDDNKTINTGIAVMRATPKTIKFLESALEVYRKNPTLFFQGYLQKRLDDKELDWGFFPRTFFCWTYGIQSAKQLPQGIQLHHANGIDNLHKFYLSLEGKLNQFRLVRSMLKATQYPELKRLDEYLRDFRQ